LLPGAAQAILPDTVAGGWLTVCVEPSQPLSPSLHPSVLLDNDILHEMVLPQVPGQLAPQALAAGLNKSSILEVDGHPALGVSYRV
jgi:hypothetical protein